MYKALKLKIGLSKIQLLGLCSKFFPENSGAVTDDHGKGFLIEK